MFEGHVAREWDWWIVSQSFSGRISLALRLSTGQAPIAEAIESSPKCRHNTCLFQVKIWRKIPGPKNKRRKKASSKFPTWIHHVHKSIAKASLGLEVNGEVQKVLDPLETTSNFNNLASWNTTKLCKLFSRATYWPWKPRLSMSSKSMSWSKLEGRKSTQAWLHSGKLPSSWKIPLVWCYLPGKNSWFFPWLC